MVRFTIAHDRSFARVFSSAELDSLCLEIGQRPGEATGAFDDDSAAFVLTAVARQGGHTRVLKDIIAADPASRKTILITNIDHRLTNKKVARILGLDDVPVEVCPDLPLGERLRWLQTRLASLSVGRGYLLQHHYDAVAIAAAQVRSVGRWIYIHHADHSLALGVTIPHAAHVDLNAKSFHNCADHQGVENNIFWPLVADPPRRDGRTAPQGRFVTCSSGGSEKFDRSRLLGELAHAAKYQDVVPEILSARGGTHIHIGKLPDEMSARIRQALRAREIDQSRFVVIPRVPNLAQALVDLGVDVYVGSFPLGGGRAAVGAMSAGVALAIYSNYRSVFFTDQTEVYPGAMIWRTPDELLDQLRALTVERLENHQRMALAFFQDHHHPDRLKNAIARFMLDVRSETPQRPVYTANALQVFLDEEMGFDRSMDRSLRKRRAPGREALRSVWRCARSLIGPSR